MESMHGMVIFPNSGSFIKIPCYVMAVIKNLLQFANDSLDNKRVNFDISFANSATIALVYYLTIAANNNS